MVSYSLLTRVLALSSALVAVACGRMDPKYVSTVSAATPLPDLAFANSEVDINVTAPYNQTIPLQANGSATVPCQATGFRAQYTYVNIGNSDAGPHVNRAYTGNQVGYPDYESPLAAGQSRTAWVTIGELPANIWTQVKIQLNDTQAINESSLDNNTWVTVVDRVCP